MGGGGGGGGSVLAQSITIQMWEAARGLAIASMPLQSKREVIVFMSLLSSELLLQIKNFCHCKCLQIVRTRR